MADGPTNYRPPESREELLRRYASGERSFPDTELSDADLVGVTLDGVSIERFSWFFSTNFEGASLRGTSFRECNVKCASFRNADLTGASFELAAVEAAEFNGARLEGVSFVGATCYGCTTRNGDHFPPAWVRASRCFSERPELASVRRCHPHPVNKRP
jgi:uncharacterized protein YjbI with pentapeptide repeats